LNSIVVVLQNVDHRFNQLRFIVGVTQLLLQLLDSLLGREWQFVWIFHVCGSVAHCCTHAPVLTVVLAQPPQYCRAILNALATLRSGVCQLAFFHLVDDRQFKARV
jgi:hypothetical protein